MKRKAAPSPLQDKSPNSFEAQPASMAFGLNAGTVLFQNHWREYYNPLRALDLQRYIALYDFSRRGLNAELQNVYREMEQLFPALIGLKSRRTAQLLRRQFTVKTIDADSFPISANQAMADAQAEFLREAYAAIDNKREVIRAMMHGFFRGWVHLEKCYAAPGTSDLTINHLEFVEQWHWTRKSMYSQWEYVAAATQSNTGVPINEDQFIIFEAPFALDRLALLLWIRANLAEKDWDAFVELYGIPKWVVIMPPNVPKEKEAEYRAAASAITRGAPGALPAGSEAMVSDGKQEGAIFRQRLDWIQEQLVLAGTGGMLSMLTAPTGIGKGPTDEHADAFDEIGDMDAEEISEIFRRQFDKPLLEDEFPGQPILAGVALEEPEETDITKVVADVLALSQAGYQVSCEQVTEMTGYEVEIKAVPGGEDDNEPGKPVKNRATQGRDGSPSRPLKITTDFEEASRRAVAASLQNDLSYAAGELSALFQITDPKQFKSKASQISKRWKQITGDTLMAPSSAETFAEIIGTKLAEGIQESKKS